MLRSGTLWDLHLLNSTFHSLESEFRTNSSQKDLSMVARSQPYGPKLH